MVLFFTASSNLSSVLPVVMRTNGVLLQAFNQFQARRIIIIAPTSTYTTRLNCPIRPPVFSVTMSTGTGQLQDDLDLLFSQKRLLRSNVRKSLKSMDPSLRTQEDLAIQSIVLEAPWFKSSRRLCAYVSCSMLREVDTSRLLSAILGNQSQGVGTEIRKKLYVPRVEDKKSHMRMLHIQQVDDLIANSMNILEPAPLDANGNEREDVMNATEPVDLLILPGLAFDLSGRRLGRGGGYYDTFLRRYQDLAKRKNWKAPLLVALSYSAQIVDEGLPVTPNDVPVDALVLASGIVPISHSALERMKG